MYVKSRAHAFSVRARLGLFSNHSCSLFDRGDCELRHYDAANLARGHEC